MQKSYLKKYNTTGGPEIVRELVLHPQHMDDLMLWKSFRSGDEKALVIIFNKFAQPLYNYGYKITGERELVKDGIQELFIELWQNKARLGETDSIKFYLFKSLRRKLIRLKTKVDNRLLKALSLDYDKEAQPSHEFVLISDQVSLEKREKLMVMLNKLTKRQHEAIFLRYFEELNCDQIAMVMNLSKQAVYNLIHHALDQLKKTTHGEY